MGSGRTTEGGDFVVVVVVVAGNLVGVMVVVARLLVVVVVVVVFRFWVVVVADVDGPRFAGRTAGEDVTTAEDAVVEFAVVDTEDVVDMIATGARLFLSLREREKHNEDGRRSVRLLLVLLGDV